MIFATLRMHIYSTHTKVLPFNWLMRLWHVPYLIPTVLPNDLHLFIVLHQTSIPKPTLNTQIPRLNSTSNTGDHDEKK
jgi:hypothetical protein